MLWNEFFTLNPAIKSMDDFMDVYSYILCMFCTAHPRYIRGDRGLRFWDRDWDLGGISLGLKAWDHSIENWVSVSMIENAKSQYQSHSLRTEGKSFGLSLKNETASVKSQSKSQEKFIILFFNCFLEVLKTHYKANSFSNSWKSQSQVSKSKTDLV
jgi:hypothetical protein